MRKVNFEVFCEKCGERVELDKAICLNCHSKLGDLECPSCGYVGIISAFENGCPKCNYSPFEKQLKKRSINRGFKRLWNGDSFLRRKFYFGFYVNVMLYLFANFLIILLFVYILFF
ncbi:zinc ribbon domain-containing protein [Borrelia crocidurae]|uniref:DZANK-type domain-containing protein n=1 Tax=Borrelia crocidurae (strain Achema) TaxID=1155096 RepID=I0FD93_BORCA|nr:zinc ribbon domain-containing protein [Borrelia crocidurae]AFI31449.1 hypothetical protein Q7M_670 [Borrelia crocidurae str. Achema]